MSLKTGNSLLHSYSFRLTIWYAALFISSLVVIFLISYRILIADLVHVVDRGLLAQTSRIDEEFSSENLDVIKINIRQSIEAEGKNRIFYRLLTSNLNVVETSDPLKWPCLNFPQMSRWASQAAGSNTIYHTLAPPDRNYKVRIISRGIAQGRYIVQIGKTMRDEEELITVYTKVFGGAVLVLFLCGTLLAWLEAQKAMARIEGLMQQLRDVTNNIAHDLRTPITRIRGLAETSLGQKADYQESAGFIVEECDRLVKVINTMLEISEADAGLKKVEQAPLDIVTLVRQGCEVFTPVAQDKGLTLQFNSLHQNLIVFGQPSRLQRVISNLLDNAIKFTPSGGRIDVEVNKEGAYVLISVRDTGIGIAPSDKGRIFEKFYRVESSRSIPGNGLGLSYVRSMVNAMAGTVSVESAPGQGSTFTIKLPLSNVIPAKAGIHITKM
jgi:signal transduction histidine kinase